MSDNGYIILRQLKDQRRKDMAKNYCTRLVQDIMKKYDNQKTGILLIRKLQNECSKHKPACIQYFNGKYLQIVQQIIKNQQKSGFIDQLQLFQQCKTIYNKLRVERQQQNHPSHFI